MGNLRETFFPNTVYHVLHHANGEDNIFRCKNNYYYFLNKYKQYISPIAYTYAYCLLPNHFHFALKIKDIEILKVVFAQKTGLKKYAEVDITPEVLKRLADEIHSEDLPLLIARQFSHFLNCYSKSFNAQYNRIGSLFRESVRRESVSNTEYYQNLIRYIHLNPVKHGFVKKATDWDYTSIHAYNSLKFSQLERNEVFDWFGGVDAFWQFHELTNETDLFL